MNKTVFVAGLVAVVSVIGALYTGSISNTPAIVSNTSNGATVGIQSVSSVSGLAAIFSANNKIISWNTMGFAANETVDVNLIRKISETPATYELVRKLADNTTNDGKLTWSPKEGELEAGLFIEVTCSGEETALSCEVKASPLAVK